MSFEAKPKGLAAQLDARQPRQGAALFSKGEAVAALEHLQQEPSEARRLVGLSLVYHALGVDTASDAALEELIEKYETNAATIWPRVGLPSLQSIGRSPEQLAAIEFEMTLPR